MNWSEIPPATRSKLLSIYSSDLKFGTKLTQHAALHLGMNPETLKRRLREFREHQIIETIPQSNSPIYDDYFDVETDNAIFISDIEFPDSHFPTLKAALLFAYQYDIRTLCVLGDLMATDQAALTHWAKDYILSDELSFRDVLQNYTKKFALGMREQFTDGVWMISGNHDLRIAKATGGNIDIGMFFEGIDGVHWSPYGYMYLRTSRGDVFACHQENFGKNPVKVAQDIYGTLPRKGHMLVTHIHRQESSTTPDGLYEVHALGTCRDAKRTGYKSLKANRHYEWNNGFVMMLDGHFYNIGMKSFNPKFWLPDYHTFLQDNEG